MKNAEQTIKEIIKNKVTVMNLYMNTKEYQDENFQRFASELRGMLICLKNITDGTDLYAVNFYDDHIEFGAYDSVGRFAIIQ